MNAYTFTDDNGINWRRITKTAARKVFESGERLVLCASNLRPFGPWHPEIEVTDIRDHWSDFNTLVNEFEYYNCSHPGEGRYASFYIPA